MRQMRSIIVLWALHISAVMSIRLRPLRIWEMLGPNVEGLSTITETPAKMEDYPYMVFMAYPVNNGGFHTCSASLIKPDWVLTAAHCFEYCNQPENVLLIGGKADLKEYMTERLDVEWNKEIKKKDFRIVESRAQKILTHPNYTWMADKILHDIALVKLKKPFNPDNVKTIPLSLHKMEEQKICTILGWGKTSSGKKYRLNVLQNKVASTSSIGCLHADNSTPTICLKTDKKGGICYGDSGSPLVCDGKVWGVASSMLMNSNECEDSSEFYYTEIWYEKNWLLSVLHNSAGRIGTVEISFCQIFVLIFVSLWIYPTIFL